MKRYIVAVALMLSPLVYGQQAYSGIPQAGAMYVSSNATYKGPWNPLMFAAGTQSYGGIPGAVGMYYSSDGTGNKGTWYPCTVATCFSGGGGGSVTLTTTGTSGAATLTGSVLNIPVYAGGSSGISGQTNGYVPLAGSATTLTSTSQIDQGVTTTGEVTITRGSGGAGGNALTVSSPNAQSTGITIYNTSGTGYKYQFFVVGSSSGTPGAFGVYNFQNGHQVMTITPNDDVAFLGKVTAPRMGSGSASNTDLNGIVTLAGGSGTYTFSGTYASAPICVASDDTALAAVKVSVTSTVLTLTGTGTDALSYICSFRN